MKEIIMCIKAIKDTGKGKHIYISGHFSFGDFFVRIHIHGGKVYTHLFVHSLDILISV